MNQSVRAFVWIVLVAGGVGLVILMLLLTQVPFALAAAVGVIATWIAWGCLSWHLIGVRRHVANHLGSPRCPTSLFFGGKDPYIPREQIENVRAHHPDTIVYETAGHAFMRDGTEHHVPEAADDAWSRLLSHFDKHLRASEHIGRSGNHRAM